MLEKLKLEVLNANLDLVKKNLVVETWGNVSIYDKKSGLVLIKPSGINYDELNIEDIVVLNLKGEVIEGKLKPSSDTKTHLEIYKNFKNVGCIIHTHSKWATIFAQAEKEIKIYGTTHADYFNGNIPLTRFLTKEEINDDYELNTGKVIVEKFKSENIEPLSIPAILAINHGPFIWGKSSKDAMKNAIVLEFIAEMAYYTEMLGNKQEIDNELLEKHYNRKHGKNAYYGQKNEKEN